MSRPRTSTVAVPASLVGVLLGLVLVVVLVATNDDGPDDELPPPVVTRTVPPEPARDLPDLPVGHGAVQPGDRVTALDGALRVNGTLVDLAPLRVEEHAVVPGGVFFRNGTELWFTDLTRVRATPFTDVRSVVASAGGLLAFVDLEHGPKDAAGTPLAMAVAYDARAGRQLVASYAGMGDVFTDDLAALYRQDPPQIRDVRSGHVFVHGPAGDFRVPLDGGPAEPWADRPRAEGRTVP